MSRQPISVDSADSPDIPDVLKARMSQRLDVEPDLSVRTVLCVKTPTTRPHTSWDYVMNIDRTLLSFPVFLGLPLTVVMTEEMAGTRRERLNCGCV